jgi:arginine-tRNA-protein transferase
VQRFAPNRSQRRTWNRAESELFVELGPLEATEEKARLYNLHKFGRGLSKGEDSIDLEGYRAFLGESCCESFELRYRRGDKLVGVAITDRSDEALSAVYCYFDPDYGRLSPGTYSILKQVDLARRWGLRYVYLGLYVAGCGSMSYKSRFLPHERLLDGQWVEFTDDSDSK